MSGRRRQLDPLDFGDLRTTSLADRPSKVRLEDFARPWEPGKPLGDFLESLPNLLAASQLRGAVAAMASAVDGKRTVLVGMGAHPIKVGLNPILIDAMERGVFSGLAMNGAGVVHDVELALAGKTSEDVAAHLDRGQFGTARETAELIHEAVAQGYRTGGRGLGRAIGEKLLQEGVPHADKSLFATAARLNLPVTVHVALGTDIVHMHPAMDGAAMGALSHYDFRLFCRLVSSLQHGVYLNLGSAVILPEVFLKAVSVTRNLGFSLEGITTINMDFQRHYRTQVNVVERPTLGAGSGINLVGHHEIMFPLLIAAVLEALAKRETKCRDASA